MNPKPDPSRPLSAADHPAGSRLFLHEPGWQIGIKVSADREFCYSMNPGDDYYHRLQGGEIFVQRERERLCLVCAERRGIITFEPRPLRDQLRTRRFGTEDNLRAVEYALSDEPDGPP